MLKRMGRCNFHPNCPLILLKIPFSFQTRFSPKNILLEVRYCTSQHSKMYHLLGLHKPNHPIQQPTHGPQQKSQQQARHYYGVQNL